MKNNGTFAKISSIKIRLIESILLGAIAIVSIVAAILFWEKNMFVAIMMIAIAALSVLLVASFIFAYRKAKRKTEKISYDAEGEALDGVQQERDISLEDSISIEEFKLIVNASKDESDGRKNIIVIFALATGNKEALRRTILEGKALLDPLFYSIDGTSVYYFLRHFWIREEVIQRTKTILNLLDESYGLEVKCRVCINYVDDVAPIDASSPRFEVFQASELLSDTNSGDQFFGHLEKEVSLLGFDIGGVVVYDETKNLYSVYREYRKDYRSPSLSLLSDLTGISPTTIAPLLCDIAAEKIYRICDTAYIDNVSGKMLSDVGIKSFVARAIYYQKRVIGFTYMASKSKYIPFDERSIERFLNLSSYAESEYFKTKLFRMSTLLDAHEGAIESEFDKHIYEVDPTTGTIVSASPFLRKALGTEIIGMKCHLALFKSNDMCPDCPLSNPKGFSTPINGLGDVTYHFQRIGGDDRCLIALSKSNSNPKPEDEDGMYGLRGKKTFDRNLQSSILKGDSGHAIVISFDGEEEIQIGFMSRVVEILSSVYHPYCLEANTLGLILKEGIDPESTSIDIHKMIGKHLDSVCVSAKHYVFEYPNEVSYPFELDVLLEKKAEEYKDKKESLIIKYDGSMDFPMSQKSLSFAVKNAVSSGNELKLMPVLDSFYDILRYGIIQIPGELGFDEYAKVDEETAIECDLYMLNAFFSTIETSTTSFIERKMEVIFLPASFSSLLNPTYLKHLAEHLSKTTFPMSALCFLIIGENVDFLALAKSEFFSLKRSKSFDISIYDPSLRYRMKTFINVEEIEKTGNLERSLAYHGFLSNGGTIIAMKVDSPEKLALVRRIGVGFYCGKESGPAEKFD